MYASYRAKFYNKKMTFLRIKKDINLNTYITHMVYVNNISHTNVDAALKLTNMKCCFVEFLLL